ncbi:MAG: hypothetical protein U0790_27020 [Isosphaeraceae bacterium]
MSATATAGTVGTSTGTAAGGDSVLEMISWASRSCVSDSTPGALASRGGCMTGLPAITTGRSPWSGRNTLPRRGSTAGRHARRIAAAAAAPARRTRRESRGDQPQVPRVRGSATRRSRTRAERSGGCGRERPATDRLTARNDSTALERAGSAAMAASIRPA